MPIYEYRCSNCGHKLEALQKISEPLLVACPSCQQDKLVKQVSAAGFHLKGSGWYVTDFKGGSSAKPAAGDEPAKPAADATTTKDGKAEPKKPAPAAASESAASPSSDTATSTSTPSKPATTTTPSSSGSA